MRTRTGHVSARGDDISRLTRCIERCQHERVSSDDADAEHSIETCPHAAYECRPSCSCSYNWQYYTTCLGLTFTGGITAGEKNTGSLAQARCAPVTREVARKLASEIEGAHLLTYNAALLREAKRPFRKEAAIAKLVASRVAQKVSSACVDLLGGNGFTRDYGLEKLYRDSKIGSIYEGTSNILLETISKDVQQDYSSLVA
ncbi:unnamed protein product [Rangifer tarandus platyrhynchus]|uniref:Short/branched chain specific acyl-CoA dehydrogenase, mitochondrial n=1 Tax=Rangifer tarandus platyrhynchus TaxID=3082113 RepID=A0ABN8XIL3_RANTA|nr:unnamed protein product [Rangifer tarandus platyrhynchus]